MQYEAQPINLFNGYGYIYFLKRVFAQTHVVRHSPHDETPLNSRANEPACEDSAIFVKTLWKADFITGVISNDKPGRHSGWSVFISAIKFDMIW